MNEQQYALLMNTAEQCVEAGIEVLSECAEADWNLYNAETLNMGSTTNCLLAQLFAGSHAKGRRTLGIPNNQIGAAYGFWWAPGVPTEYIRMYYQILTAVWKETIEEHMAFGLIASDEDYDFA